MNVTKKFLLLLPIQVVIIIFLTLFFVNHFEDIYTEYTYSQEQMIDLESGESSAYIDTGYDNFAAKRIGLKDVILPKGTYDVEIIYQAAGLVHAGIEYEHKRHEYKVSGTICLEDNTNTQNIKIRVKEESPLCFYGRINSEGISGNYLLIQGIKISRNFIEYQVFLFWMAIVFLIIDACLFLYWKRINIFASKEKRMVAVVIGIITFISCSPLFTNYLLEGQDLYFHLSRIEGIKNGLLNGDFPVRIQPQWLNGHGYPVSIFYPDVLLYIPALLRIVGFSVQNTYKFYLIGITLLTAISSYYSFKKIANNDTKVGLVAAAIYTLNLYRMTNVYVRAAVGEYTATAFFPLVLYGLWSTFFREREDLKEDKNVWKILAIGFLGIVNSHAISCILIALITVLLCLFNIRKIFEKVRFQILLKAFVFLVLGGIAVILPLLEYMRLNFRISDKTTFVFHRQEERSLFFAQFFSNYYDVNSESKATGLGMAGEMPLTLGITFLVIVLAVVFISIYDFKAIKVKKEWIISVGLCAVFMWLSSIYFPYAELAGLSEVAKKLFGSIQYPWRFLVIISLISAWVFIILVQRVNLGEHTEEYKKLFIYTVCIALLYDITNMTGHLMNEKSAQVVVDQGNLNSAGVMGGEYLYIDANVDDYIEKVTNIGSEVEVFSMERAGGSVLLDVVNYSSETKTLEIPLIMYKGYMATDVDTKEKLDISDGTSNRIVLHLKPNYAGKVCVEFVEPWYWRVAEVVSLVACIYILISFPLSQGEIKIRVKRKKQ